MSELKTATYTVRAGARTAVRWRPLGSGRIFVRGRLVRRNRGALPQAAQPTRTLYWCSDGEIEVSGFVSPLFGTYGVREGKCGPQYDGRGTAGSARKRLLQMAQIRRKLLRSGVLTVSNLPCANNLPTVLLAFSLRSA